MTRRVGVALVHAPVLGRGGEVVTTAVTNLDVHDIARSAFTYGIEQYFVVHPIAAQRELVDRIVSHWTTGSGARRIPDRRLPMEMVRIVNTLPDAVVAMGEETEVWVTSAKDLGGSVCHGAAKELLQTPGPPVLLVFGTGWGLADEILADADRALAPIVSRRPDGYNHLSVRAAAAILFDRLLDGGPSR